MKSVLLTTYKETFSIDVENFFAFILLPRRFPPLVIEYHRCRQGESDAARI